MILNWVFSDIRRSCLYVHVIDRCINIKQLIMDSVVPRVKDNCLSSDALPCAPGWRSCGQGVCLVDPLFPKRSDCKCDKGFFEDFPYGCIGM